MEYPKVLQCYQCSKVIGKWQITTFAKAYKGYTIGRKRRCFCNEQCYKSYTNKFVVYDNEKYKIYKIYLEDGKEVYVPYLSAPYYFTTIEDCKKRMESKNIGFYLGGL